MLDIKEEERPELITLDNYSYELSANFAKWLEPLLATELEGMADFAGKLHGTILRIAGILHVVNQQVFAGKESLPATTMADAIELGHYFLAHAKAAYQLMGSDERVQVAKYILKKLESQSETQLKRYNIFKMCRSAKIINVDDIDPYITLLTDFNYLRELPTVGKVGAGRKPDIVYALNPLYFKTVV